MKTKFIKTVQFLENLQIMPKTMPGLQKIKKALEQTEWYSKINPESVIVVAGTNGKGSTCATLEALLLDAGQKVGFYSSPHLVSTNERIRMNGENISEENFVKVFEECESLIRSCDLSHFEALTLMAGHFYFSEKWNQKVDYVIFEVGLGGTFDATNAFPHRYSVITPLGIDHASILGNTLAEIAPNKFGIVHENNLVVFSQLPIELNDLKNSVLKNTSSQGFEVPPADLDIQKNAIEPKYILKTKWGHAELSLKGRRAAENAMTALSTFANLGFDPSAHLKALNQVVWPGRMQKIDWPGSGCPVYLSGDHNPQGVRSLLEILKDFSWDHIHVIAGIGVDKDADEMLGELTELKNAKLYLTVTPFKGRTLNQYPKSYLDLAVLKKENPIEILNDVAQSASGGDLIIVTGSLYLVGEVLKFVNR